MSVSPALRVAILAASIAIAATIVGTGGCASTNTTVAPLVSPTPAASVSPSASASPVASPQVLVSLTYLRPSPTPTTDPTFGQVDGYGVLAAQPSATSTPAPSQVITVVVGQTIQFLNFDAASLHTASLLGPANGTNWPATFTNANGASAASPAGANITDSQFSTGALAADTGGNGPGRSFIYGTGVPGMYYFGDFYDYVPQSPALPSMRTVIIVM